MFAFVCMHEEEGGRAGNSHGAAHTRWQDGVADDEPLVQPTLSLVFSDSVVVRHRQLDMR